MSAAAASARKRRSSLSSRGVEPYPLACCADRAVFFHCKLSFLQSSSSPSNSENVCADASTSSATASFAPPRPNPFALPIPGSVQLRVTVSGGSYGEHALALAGYTEVIATNVVGAERTRSVVVVFKKLLVAPFSEDRVGDTLTFEIRGDSSACRGELSERSFVFGKAMMNVPDEARPTSSWNVLRVISSLPGIEANAELRVRVAHPPRCYASYAPDVSTIGLTYLPISACFAVAKASGKNTAESALELRDEIAEVPLGLLVPAEYLDARADTIETTNAELYSTEMLRVQNMNSASSGAFALEERDQKFEIAKHIAWCSEFMDKRKSVAAEYRQLAARYRATWNQVCVNPHRTLGHLDALIGPSESSENGSVRPSPSASDAPRPRPKRFFSRRLSLRSSSYRGSGGAESGRSEKARSSRQRSHSSAASMREGAADSKDQVPPPRSASAQQAPSNALHRPVSFRPSSWRKKKAYRSMPINAHLQVLTVRDGETGAVHLYDALSVGAPAAHTMGFDRGSGLSSAGASAASTDPQSPTHRGGIVAEYQAPGSMPPLDFGTSLADIRAAKEQALETQRRKDEVFPQALSALASVFSSRLYIAGIHKPKHYDNAWAKDMVHHGVLMGWVSLLSTRGKEYGMLLDTKAAVDWLNSDVRIKLSEASDGKGFSASVGAVPVQLTGSSSSSSNAWCRWILHINVPSKVYLGLPEPLRAHAGLLSVECALFSQGVNEHQSVANAFAFLGGGGHNLQTDLNAASNAILERRVSLRFDDDEESIDINDRASRIARKKAFVILAKLKYALDSKAANDKNYSLISLSSSLVRCLGGLILFSCKSAKDRTAQSMTLEESRILVQNHYLKVEDCLPLANLLRADGVRLHNVRKNTGVAKYAFNKIQRKMLPKVLRPPSHTIGGLFRRGNQS